MGKITFVLAVVAQLTFTLSSIGGSPFSKNQKNNLAGFKDVLRNSPKILPSHLSKKKVKEDSNFQRLQTAYFKRQQTLYSESRSISAAMEDGSNEVFSSCSSCASNTPLGREITQCYSGCITGKMESFNSYAVLIGDIVQNLFCAPLGFKFETLYMSKHPKTLMSFGNFVKTFNENADSFSLSSQLAMWMSNLLWLDKSPIHTYSYIRSQLAVDIANLQNSSISTSAPYGTSTQATPAQFGAKCGSQWDLRKSIYSLVNAAKQKSHFLDVILPGLFAIRSAGFYTRGNYVNLASGMMEALSTFIGRKCDIIAYSNGAAENDANGDSCDGIGGYPIPQFPVPLTFSKLLSPCGEYEGSKARVALVGTDL